MHCARNVSRGTRALVRMRKERVGTPTEYSTGEVDLV
jgi:hypothetical protein